MISFMKSIILSTQILKTLLNILKHQPNILTFVTKKQKSQVYILFIYKESIWQNGLNNYGK